MDNPFANLKPTTPTEIQVTQPISITPGHNIAHSLPKGIQITNEQFEALQQYSRDMQFGVSNNAPIICKAELCPYYTKCPINRAGIELPVGKDCSVEVGLQKMWIAEFMKASGVDPKEIEEYTYDLLLINDLSFYQVLENRAAMELSVDPKIVQDQFVGWDMDHKPIYTKSLNSIILFKEKVHKMKMTLLRELIATRKAKSDDQKSAYKDRSSQVAELLRRVKNVGDSNSMAKPKIIDVEHNVKSH